jgi:hypothetical protein
MVALSYPIRSQQALPGLHAESLSALTRRNYINPSAAQVSTATVGGTTTDGIYSVTVTADDVRRLLFTRSTVRRPRPTLRLPRQSATTSWPTPRCETCTRHQRLLAC